MSEYYQNPELTPKKEAIYSHVLRDIAMSVLPVRNGVESISTKFRFGPTKVGFELVSIPGRRQELYIDITELFSQGADTLTRNCAIDLETAQVINFLRFSPELSSAERRLQTTIYEDPTDDGFVELMDAMERTYSQADIDEFTLEVAALVPVSK